MLETMSMCPDLDEVIGQPRLVPPKSDEGKTRIMDITTIEDAVFKTRLMEFDYYLDFHGVFQSALFGLLSNIPIRVGRSPETTKDGAYLFYTKHVNFENNSINRMMRHFTLVNTVFPSARIIIPPRPKIRNESPIIVVPMATKLGRLKQWPLDNYRRLIELMISRNKRPIIVAGASFEKNDLEVLVSHLKGRVSLFVASNIGDYFKLIKKAFMVAGTDGAVLHIATILNVPSFMIFGPSSPFRNSPWDKCLSSYVWLGVSCSPCNFWHGRCAEDHRCMNELSPDYVFSQLQSFIERCEVSGRPKS